MLASAPVCTTPLKLSSIRMIRILFMGLLFLCTVMFMGFLTQLNNTKPFHSKDNHKGPLIIRAATHFESMARKASCSGCFPHDFQLLINNEKICKGNKPVDLVLLIFSKASRVAERYAIRSTWASASNNNTADVRHVFLFGMSRDENASGHIHYESRIFGDIVQEDFIDTYYNLTLKTIMGFKWASTFCSQARFVMKVDDDVLINIPRLLAVINLRKAILQTSIGGCCSSTERPVRSHDSKWYISNKTFPGSLYPPYCFGSGYVTSMHVAREVVKISRDIPFLFLEDVYVGLCLAKLGFNVTNIRGFNIPSWYVNPCLPSTSKVLMVHFMGKPLPKLPYFYNKTCKRNFLTQQRFRQRI